MPRFLSNMCLDFHVYLFFFLHLCWLPTWYLMKQYTFKNNYKISYQYQTCFNFFIGISMTSSLNILLKIWMVSYCWVLTLINCILISREYIILFQFHTRLNTTHFQTPREASDLSEIYLAFYLFIAYAFKDSKVSRKKKAGI